MGKYIQSSFWVRSVKSTSGESEDASGVCLGFYSKMFSRSPTCSLMLVNSTPALEITAELQSM